MIIPTFSISQIWRPQLKIHQNNNTMRELIKWHNPRQLKHATFNLQSLPAPAPPAASPSSPRNSKQNIKQNNNSITNRIYNKRYNRNQKPGISMLKQTRSLQLEPKVMDSRQTPVGSTPSYSHQNRALEAAAADSAPQTKPGQILNKLNSDSAQNILIIE